MQTVIGFPGHPREQSVGEEPPHPYPAHGPAVLAIPGEGLVRTIARQRDANLPSSLHRQAICGKKRVIAERLVEVPHQTLEGGVRVVRLQHSLVMPGAIPLRDGPRPFPFIERGVGEADGE